MRTRGGQKVRRRGGEEGEEVRKSTGRRGLWLHILLRLLEHAINPWQEALCAMVSVEDDGDAVSRRQLAHVERACAMRRGPLGRAGT